MTKQKKHQLKPSKNQLGVTLIELMVAMAVSSVIMLGISNIYLSTKKSYVVHDEFSRIQENGRYSMETLSTNIRNAGFFGCASGQGLGTVTNDLNDSEEVTWNFETGVMGFEAVGTDIGETRVINPTVISGVAADWTTAAGMTSSGTPIVAAVDGGVLGNAIAGSDILIMRTTDGTGVRIRKNNGGAQVFVDDTTGGVVANSCPQNAALPGLSEDGISGLCEGDILLISNCSQSLVFQATGIAPGGGPGGCGSKPCFNLVHSGAGGSIDPGNKSPIWPPETQFGPESEIMKVVSKTYFVGIPAGGGEPSLYVQQDGGVPQQLVEGIENMQILYGVDTNGDGAPNRYFSADDVPDVDGDSDSVFDGVVSVKISLLARTPEAMPGINRTVADYANLTYNMVSPATPITIDPIPVDAASTDRRMRKVFNMTIKIRNKSFNISS